MKTTRRGFLGFLAASSVAVVGLVVRKPRDEAPGPLQIEEETYLANRRVYGLPKLPKEPTEIRSLWLGLAAQRPMRRGDRAKVRSITGQIIQPERIIIPNSVAKHFVIHGFRIDAQEQLMSSASIPAGVFVPESAHSNLALPRGMIFEIDVECVGWRSYFKSRKFRAAINGIAYV